MKKIHWSIAKRLFRLFTPRYRVVRRRGCLFLLDNKNWIDTRLLIGQPYERKQIASAIELIAKHEMDVFVDVGANIGVYSIALATHCVGIGVLSFEPVVRNYNQLCANVFVNGLNHVVTPVNQALSNTNAAVSIQIDPTSTGVSCIEHESTEVERSSYSENEQIQCVVFDDEYSYVNRKMFVKIDVEGHEIQVIQGMQNTLKHNSVILQVEILSDESNEEIVKILKSLEYRCIGCIGDDYRYTNI